MSSQELHVSPLELYNQSIEEVKQSGITQRVKDTLFSHEVLAKLEILTSESTIYPSHQEIEAMMVQNKMPIFPKRFFTPIKMGDLVFILFVPFKRINQFQTFNVNRPNLVDLITVTDGFLELQTKDREKKDLVVFRDHNSPTAIAFTDQRLSEFHRHSTEQLELLKAVSV